MLLGGGFIFYLFSPRKLGKIFTHFDKHIFQRVWGKTTNQVADLWFEHQFEH